MFSNFYDSMQFLNTPNRVADVIDTAIKNTYNRKDFTFRIRLDKGIVLYKLLLFFEAHIVYSYIALITKIQMIKKLG